MGATNSEPVYMQWYRTMIVDNQKDIYDIACTSAERLKKSLRIPIGPEMTIALYCGMLESFMHYLKEKQKDFPEFWINIWDTLEIGYNTLENDEDEKTGNFNIKIYYLQDAPKVVTNSTLQTTDEIVSAWVAAHNMNVDTDYLIRDIFAFSKEYLMGHFNLTVERPETLLLIFLCINNEMVFAVKMKRQELQASDFFITIAGLFQIHCQDTDKGEMVMFKTEPAPKQFIKDDGVGTAKFEE